MANTISALVVMCFIAGNVWACQKESATAIQQTAGRLKRFTQYELDVAFRKQSRENLKLGYDDKKLCCVIVPKDVRMMNVLIEHFKDNISKDIEGYGLRVLEDERSYIVHVYERYLQSTQELIHGYWNPSISGELGQYRYIINRDTLDIIDFTEIPQ